MGRKKRPANSNNGAVAPQPPQYGGYGMGGGPIAAPPPPPMAFDQYGRPLPPPPMPPMPMPPNQQQQQQQLAGGGPPATKRSRDNKDPPPPPPQLEEGERNSYPVKKYRPDSYYRSIESFQRYTKAHRMSDASYVRWHQGGGTPEKPVVFGIRVAGDFLSWGRGKTRDAAIDACIRAAFALVAAHGYDDYAMTDDCFTEEPSNVQMMAPIPPPPPPPPGVAPLPPGVAPPLPPGGLPPNFANLPPGALPPPNFPAPPPMAEEMIPQPSAPSANLAVASTVEGGGGMLSSGGAITKVSVGLIPTAISSTGTNKSTTTSSTSETKKKSSSGLVFMGDTMDEGGEELSMEELRMRVPRYWTLVVRALAKRNA